MADCQGAGISDPGGTGAGHLWRHPPQSPAVPGPGGRGKGEGDERRFHSGGGSGSVIDASKAIALGVANSEADLWDFWLRKQPVEHMLPVGAVLTISAAGSETSDSAVLTRDDTMEKRGLSSQLFRPRFAVMDPELTYTLPPYQIACGVVDMMMHTLDRYFTSVTDNTLTDEIARVCCATRCAGERKRSPPPTTTRP